MLQIGVFCMDLSPVFACNWGTAGIQNLKLYPYAVNGQYVGSKMKRSSAKINGQSWILMHSIQDMCIDKKTMLHKGSENAKVRHFLPTGRTRFFLPQKFPYRASFVVKTVPIYRGIRTRWHHILENSKNVCFSRVSGAKKWSNFPKKYHNTLAF